MVSKLGSHKAGQSTPEPSRPCTVRTQRGERGLDVEVEGGADHRVGFGLKREAAG